LHLVGGALLLRWRCTCLMRPPQATASLFAEIFSRFDATYQFTFQRPHGTVTAFSATGQLLLQHSFTEDELQLHSLRRCLSDPPPAPRPSCPCSVPSQRLVPATPLHGPLPTPCPDSGWSSPCKPRCITTLWSIQWGSLYDDMRRGAFSVPIPCPSVGPSTAAPKNRKRTPGDTSGVTHLFVFCGGKPPFGCPQSDPQ
jgi:hypothetical protein